MNYKPLAIGVATVIGIAHLGVLGHLLQVLKEDNKVIMPSINLPTGPYSSYKVNVSKQGYQLQYNANDPKVLKSRRVLDLNEAKNIDGGFLRPGQKTLEDRKEYETHEYTMDGYRNTGEGGPVNSGKLTAKQVECIKAAGSGESTGAMVGAGIAGSVAPALTAIPYVGWLASGWAVMFGQDKGAELGGTVATALKDCDA
jgi:hypothetical protein|tara:strand:+ start:403 stop:999 length:597 start_codon:yes stop_codon:yes gene_type:complete